MSFLTNKRGDYIKNKNDKFTDEWFKEKIYAMRDDVEILSEYHGKYSDITCRCKKHPDYTFTVKATNLSNGSGKCKICSFESKHLEGKTFGRLTVLGLDEELSLKKRNAYWRCKCICGTEVSVLQARLLNGDKISCGCAKNRSNNKL